jgi:PelA/Pel-15E family pectate lyase
MSIRLSALPRPALISAAAFAASTALAVNIPDEFPAHASPPAERGAEAPHAWPADAFLPVTADRIAALPASEQPVWRAYLAASQKRAALLPPRDLVDHSSTKPLAGGPIGSSYSRGVRLGAPADYYTSEPARRVADHVVNWQTAVGAWVKSGDYSRDRKPEDDHHDAWSGGTFDNDSTIFELRYLALVAHAAPESDRSRAWRAAFLRGLDFVFASQYPNGGFPQIYPLVGWYHDAVTFNDDAMVHILELLRDISERKAEFAFVPQPEADRARMALERGIHCVLTAQLQTPSGRLLAWGQQYDPLTLQPCAARNFEPIAACSNESVGLTQFLMTIPNPPARVGRAIDGAMAWFAATAFHGVIWNRRDTSGSGLVKQAGAPDLWARYYELSTGRPVFGERDRRVHYAVTELSDERRLGYAWFNSRAATLPAAYAAWKQRSGR